MTPPQRGEDRAEVTAPLVSSALLVCGGVAVVVWIAALDAALPGPGRLGDISPQVVPVLGPPLVLAGVVVGVAAWSLRRRRPRCARTVAAGAVGGAGLLAVPVGLLLAVTLQAGGSVNPAEAVALTSAPRSTIDERPVYLTTGAGQQLHLAVDRPAAVPGRAPGHAPVMVYVHGGGWAAGSELARLPDLRRLAADGWLVVSVEYTLSSPGHPTWDSAGPQVACALTRVAALAGEWGADASRLVLSGDSAGGQLAVSVGYHAAAGTQPSSCGGQVPVPRAVVAEYPPVDLVDSYDHGARSSSPGRDARWLAATYTGGTPSEVPDRYRAVSGAAGLTPAAPATLILSPTEDSLVPPAGVARFAAAARAVGVPVDLVRLPYADHAFDTFADGSLGHQAGFSIIESWSRAQVERP